jgi:hypothetical protein
VSAPPGGARLPWADVIPQAGTTISWTVAEHHPASGSSAEGPPGARQLDVCELFVHAVPAEQRQLDLLGVVMIDRTDRTELLAFGPQTMRAQTVPSGLGLVVGELHLGSAEGVRRVSVLVLALPRRPRFRAVGASVDNLARSLDYARDPGGSSAVAELLLTRVRTLMSMPDVRVAVSGATEMPDDSRLLHRLLTAGDGANAQVHDGRTMTVDADGAALPWRAANFALLRSGPRRPARDEIRSIHQLRQQHALVNIGFDAGSASTEPESWSVRAARVRQTLRAGYFVWAALSGDRETARSIHRETISQPNSIAAFAVDLRRRVDSGSVYWPVNEMLEDLAREPDLPSATRADADRIASALYGRLEDLLGLSRYPSAPEFQPIILEVSPVLLPAVHLDDDRAFRVVMDEEIRPGLHDETGVLIPRAGTRVDADLRAGEFRVLVDEQPVFTGRAAPAPDAVYAVTPHGVPVGHRYLETDRDPLTHRSGSWAVSRIFVDRPDEASCLSTGQYLAHCLESAVRDRLHHFVGVQEVDDLVRRWKAESSEPMVLTLLPGSRAEIMRLSWVLRDVVAQGFSIADWRALLAVIHRTGGLAAPMSRLVSAVCDALRTRTGRRGHNDLRLPVPVMFDVDMLSTPAGGRRFLRWLENTGRGVRILNLVAADDGVRDLVAALCHSSRRPIVVGTDAELEHP